jgi:hypothetical protein
LGEVQLASDAQAAPAAETWLADTLGPLNLQSDFQAVLFMSAQEAMARANQVGQAADQEGHIHLRVLVPAGCSYTDGQTWGFFRVWKSDDPYAGQHSRGHVIALYLYPDGQ